MKYNSINEENYDVFYKLMDAYYKDGEDAETPQSEIDDFINYLYNLCVANKISGCIFEEDEPLGFVLWNKDIKDGLFSNLPGFGTILEIGVSRSYQKNGLGSKMVKYAEEEMRKTGLKSLYVCAYGPAEEFWKKCGYKDDGKIAENRLKIFVKNLL